MEEKECQKREDEMEGRSRQVHKIKPVYVVKKLEREKSEGEKEECQKRKVALKMEGKKTEGRKKGEVYFKTHHMVDQILEYHKLARLLPVCNCSTDVSQKVEADQTPHVP